MATQKDPNFWSIRAEKKVQENNIDWGTVASKITTELETIRDDRQTRKDAIEEATNSMMNELAKNEDINDATLSTALINGGQSATEALQIQYDLLKKGFTKPKDYKIFLQKQQNAYTNLKNVVNNWDKWNTKSTERLARDPESGIVIASQLEQDLNLSTASFGNMNNIEFIPTPTGGMEAVRLIDDGNGNMVMPNRKDHPENFMNPNVIGSRQKFEMNTVDLVKAMQKSTGALGTFLLEESQSSGTIFKSIEDIRKRDDYKTSKDTAILAQTSTALGKANVLGQMGSFRFAGSDQQRKQFIADGVNADDIVMYEFKGGQPVFADDAFDKYDEQIDKYLGDIFDSQLVQKTGLEKGVTPVRPNPVDSKVKIIEEKRGTNIKNFNNILTGDPGQVAINLEALIEDYNVGARNDAKQKIIIGYDFTDESIVFRYDDNTTSTGIDRLKQADFDVNEDGVIDDKDKVAKNMASQIYALGEVIKREAFDNQAEVEDWIKNNNFEVGKQRGGISSEDAIAQLIQQGKLRDINGNVITEASQLQSAPDANSTNQEKLKYKNQQKLIKETIKNTKDNLIVDFQSPDYDSDLYSDPSSFKSYDGKVTPNTDTNASSGQVIEFMDEAIDGMLGTEIMQEITGAGGKITLTTSSDWNSSSGLDANSGESVTFKVFDGAGDVVNEYTMKMSDLNKYIDSSIKNETGEVSYYDMAREIEEKFVIPFRNTLSKKKTSKRTQKGSAGIKFNG